MDSLDNKQEMEEFKCLSATTAGTNIPGIASDEVDVINKKFMCNNKESIIAVTIKNKNSTLGFKNCFVEIYIFDWDKNRLYEDSTIIDTIKPVEEKLLTFKTNKINKTNKDKIYFCMFAIYNTFVL